jgi:single-strand DNA-binding protein
MNSVHLCGNVGQIEVKTIPSGKKVVQLSLATTEKIKEENITTWHNVKAWGYLADLPIQKGNEIIVFGKLQVESYTDKDGNKRTNTYVLAHTIKVAQRLAKIESNTSNSFIDDIDTPF